MSERLSNPNIFVVHNRSDAFAGEDMQNEVKSQHMDRAVKFLVNELNVCSNRAEAEDRIYFISAKEALQARMQEAKGQPPQISTEDFFPRYLEFQKFEREFTACLSQSAVQTKFSAHSKKGQQIVKDMAVVMGVFWDSYPPTNVLLVKPAPPFIFCLVVTWAPWFERGPSRFCV